MKRQRKLKIQETRHSRWDKSTPSILLKGQWLNDFGFEAEQHVSVECEDGKLIITINE